MMRIRLSQRPVFLCLFVLSLVLAPAAYAQDATPIPSPQEIIATAEKGEILVIVATFDQIGEQAPESQAMLEQFDAVMQEVKAAPELEGLPIRIEASDTVVNDNEAAEALADTYSATMIIWGDFDNSVAHVRYLVVSPEIQGENSTPDMQFELSTSTTYEIDSQFENGVNGGYLRKFIPAIILHSAQFYEEALPLFEAALEEVKNESIPTQKMYGLGATWYFVGYIRYVINKDLVGAEAAYTQAIILHLDYLAAYIARGRIRFDQAKWDEAISDYCMAIRLNPSESNTYLDRGSAFHRRGMLEEAIVDYTKSIELNPEVYLSYYGRGLVYYDQGKSNEAIDDFNRALELNPQDANSYASRGLALDYQDKRDEAIKDYTRAITINPTLAGAYYNRGNALYKQLKMNEAMADYIQAIALDPQFTYAYAALGQVYDYKGDFVKAIENYQLYLDLAGDDAFPYLINRFNELKKFIEA